MSNPGESEYVIFRNVRFKPQFIPKKPNFFPNSPIVMRQRLWQYTWCLVLLGPLKLRIASVCQQYSSWFTYQLDLPLLESFQKLFIFKRLMKWYFFLLCFILEWNTKFLTRWTFWLSIYKVISSCSFPIQTRSLVTNHLPSYFLL